jgi:hypothetical protein
MRGWEWCLAGAVVLSGFGSPAFGERVGYKFEGALSGPATGTYTLFGVAVPRNSVIKGTFAYDTTVVGTEIEPGAKAFPQTIAGGYTLEIHNGAIKLAASEYKVTVANDFVRTLDPLVVLDLFSVDFDSRFVPTPQKIVVNEIPFAGATAFIKTELNWPGSTFADPGEPLLTADRPGTPEFGQSAFVGSSGSARLMNITSVTPITPSAADYNVDGVVNNYDFTEWSRAFGGSSAELLYADGNDDLTVDAADYSVWRDAMSGASAAIAVPEPAGWMIFLSMCGMLRRHVMKPRR